MMNVANFKAVTALAATPGNGTPEPDASGGGFTEIFARLTAATSSYAKPNSSTALAATLSDELTAHFTTDIPAELDLESAPKATEQTSAMTDTLADTLADTVADTIGALQPPLHTATSAAKPAANELIQHYNASVNRLQQPAANLEGKPKPAAQPLLATVIAPATNQASDAPQRLNNGNFAPVMSAVRSTAQAMPLAQAQPATQPIQSVQPKSSLKVPPEVNLAAWQAKRSSFNTWAPIENGEPARHVTDALLQQSVHETTRALNPPSSSAPLAASTGNVSIPASVGSQAWQKQMNGAMLQMVTRNQNELVLKVRPAELGPIQIQMNQDDGKTQLAIFTHSHHVRAALEAALPQLREAMNAQGLTLADAEFHQHNETRQEFQHGSSQHSKDSEQRSAAQRSEPDELAEAPMQDEPRSEPQPSSTRVDLYA